MTANPEPADPWKRNAAREAEKIALSVIKFWLSNRGDLHDSSAKGDLDFRITYHDGRRAVGDVGWDTDPDIEAMWKALVQYGQVLRLSAGLGRWAVAVELRPTIKRQVKRVFEALPGIIARLRASEVDELVPAAPLSRYLRDPTVKQIADDAKALGIARLSQTIGHRDGIPVDENQNYAYVHPTQPPGFDQKQPVSLGAYVDAALARMPDLLDKVLADKTAHERHIVIMAGSATPPSVERCLELLTDPIDSPGPHLPNGITHIWLVSALIDNTVGPVAAFWTEGRWRVVSGFSLPPADPPSG